MLIFNFTILPYLIRNRSCLENMKPILGYGTELFMIFLMSETITIVLLTDTLNLPIIYETLDLYRYN